jgi:hypothetical protein
MSVCLSTCLSFGLPACLSLCLCIYLCIYLSTYLPTHLPICLSHYLSFYFSSSLKFTVSLSLSPSPSPLSSLFSFRTSPSHLSLLISNFLYRSSETTIIASNSETSWAYSTKPFIETIKTIICNKLVHSCCKTVG